MTRRQWVSEWATPQWLLDAPEPFAESDSLRPLIMQPGSVIVVHGRVRAMFEVGLADQRVVGG